VTYRNLSSSAKTIDIFKKPRNLVKFITMIHGLAQRLTQERSCTKAFYPHTPKIYKLFTAIKI